MISYTTDSYKLLENQFGFKTMTFTLQVGWHYSLPTQELSIVGGPQYLNFDVQLGGENIKTDDISQLPQEYLGIL